MSSARQNRHIARLIVGAMSIDGSLNKEEQQKVAKSLDEIGMPELIADVGAAIEEDTGDFNLYRECKELRESLGADADQLSPIMFKMISEVIAHDRFVSVQEATYLSSIARRLELTSDQAKKIFRQALTENRSRLETSGNEIDELLNPYLKDILTFAGADDLVGEISEDSLEEKLHQAQEMLGSSCDITAEDVDRSLTVLGLGRTSSLADAEEVWRDTIEGLELPKMANLGEQFVTSAIGRITRINDAYKTILHFHEHLKAKDNAEAEIEDLQKKIERSKEPSSVEDLSTDLESKLTGVGTNLRPEKDA